jgi:hypothetical protein
MFFYNYQIYNNKINIFLSSLMFYLKINEKIRELLDLFTNYRLGCKNYCKYQLIAVDEFELLFKELERNKLKIITQEEISEIKKSSESVYFHNTHICQSVDNSTKREVESDAESFNEEFLEKSFNNDKIRQAKNQRPLFNAEIDYDQLSKQKDEEQILKNKQEPSKAAADSTVSFAFSMISSFFLLVLGSYYLGKYVFELEEQYNYILVLVVTIIVVLAETILLILKLHQESVKYSSNSKLKENSFAYRFNRRYRQNMSGNKVHSTKTKTD